MNDRDETNAQGPSERSGTAVIAETDERDPHMPRDEAQRADASSPQEDEAASMPLFSADAGDGYQKRWQEVQSRFVDDPPTAVKDADQLIADLMQELARSFNEERTRLEEAWKGGGQVSTEELRLAPRRYRSFFGRLLNV